MGTRVLCQDRQSYRPSTTLKTSEYGSVFLEMAVVYRHLKEHRHRHRIQYLVFVVDFELLAVNLDEKQLGFLKHVLSEYWDEIDRSKLTSPGSCGSVACF